MLVRSLLSEFDADIRSAIRAKQRDLDTLREAVYSKMRADYVKASQSVIDELHADTGLPAPKFDLTAKWKEKQLRDRADRMARSVHETLDKETERLRAKHKGTELASKTKALKDAKVADLDAMAGADAQFGALVDQLGHSGAIDTKRDRIMYFTGSPAPCSLCVAISAANPYTVDEATNLGAKAHPNCRDHWERKQWDMDAAEKAVLKRRVKDGTVQLWSGKGQTPTRGPAGKVAATTEQSPADFRAVRRYALRTARRKGVPEDVVDAALTKAEKKRRAYRAAAKVRAQPRGFQRERLRMFERE